MKTKTKHLIGFAALLAITATTAVHAQGGPDPAKMLKRLDLNGDGAVTRDEARTSVAQRFAKLDANNDGRITADERKRPKRGGSKRADRFRAMDTNGDGAVTVQELEAATQRPAGNRFTRMDTDGNGVLTLAEVEARGKNRKARGPMTLQDLDARTMRMFDRADQNRDGTITPDEANAMRHNGRRN